MRAPRAHIREVSATAAITGLRMAGAALSFALATLLSALLGAGDAGRFFAAISWATGLTIIALWGFPQLVLHEIPPMLARARRTAVGPLIRSMMVANAARLFGLLAVSGLGVLAFRAITGAGGAIMDMLFAAAAAFLLLTIRTATSTAKALGLPGRATALEFVLVPGLAIGLCVFFLFGGDADLWGAIVLYIATLAVAAAAAYAGLQQQLPGCRFARRSDPAPWKQRRFVFAQIETGQFLTAMGAIAFLPLVLSSSDVGILNLVLRIAGLVSLVTATIPSIFIPRLATLQAEGDRAGFARTLGSLRLIMGMSGVGAYAAIVLLGPGILALAGPDFLAGAQALPWAAAGFCAALVLGPAGTELTLLGHEKVLRNTILPLGILGVVASLVAGWLAGPVWASAMPGAAAFLARAAQLAILRQVRARTDQGGAAP